MTTGIFPCCLWSWNHGVTGDWCWATQRMSDSLSKGRAGWWMMQSKSDCTIPCITSTLYGGSCFWIHITIIPEILHWRLTRLKVPVSVDHQLSDWQGAVGEVGEHHIQYPDHQHWCPPQGVCPLLTAFLLLHLITPEVCLRHHHHQSDPGQWKILIN